MKEILVLVEHRGGQLRDVTLEMLTQARSLAGEKGATVSAVLLGASEVRKFTQELSFYADRVLTLEQEQLSKFNSSTYQSILSRVIHSRNPILVLIGHTALGMDLAPSLAVELGFPLLTDCIQIELKDGTVTGIRQMYGGKVQAKVRFQKQEPYIVTLRQGVFPSERVTKSGEIVSLDMPLPQEPRERKFIGYEEMAAGEVDITESDVIVAIGRGIKDKDNLTLAQELAHDLGGVLAGSRPVIDAGWLSEDRQVGISGRTVTPKLYIALGISGAFQHLVGMQSAETIIAVNKDSEAPIFEVADYGVVGDIFQVVPALRQHLSEMKNIG